MKYLHLIWAGLMRKKIRTVLTLFSIMAAFSLFGLLDATRVAFNAPDSVAGINRLIVTSKVSIIQPLPYADYARIKALPGVKAVSWANWFGGIYQDPKNFFANIAVKADTFLQMHPEIVLPAAQKKAFLSTRTGAIVGKALADRFGWKVGDRIPLQATIFPNKDGSNTWTFDLVGIFHASEPELSGIEQQMLFRYSYFDEARTFGHGTVGWCIVQVTDPALANQVAQAIDKLFANSADETKTQSEKEFQLAFAKQIGDIGLIVTAIMAAVFFTLILLTGNTMSQAIRDRIPELAVLKTIGFTNRSVLLMVLAESLLLLGLGGVLGLLGARLLLPVMAAASGGQFVFPITASTWLLGVGLMMLIGIVVGTPPALRAMHLKITDALAGR